MKSLANDAQSVSFHLGSTNHESVESLEEEKQFLPLPHTLLQQETLSLQLSYFSCGAFLPRKWNLTIIAIARVCFQEVSDSVQEQWRKQYEHTND
jgi:hypothetical protein